MSSLLLSGAVGRSREALLRARNRVIFAIPEAWRGRVAAALPRRLVPPEMRPGFFEHFFDEGDPFGFDRNPEEQLKFRRTLEVCGENALGRVLELGCAVGTFTELLAPRAEEVVALDVSQAAVDRVNRDLSVTEKVRRFVFADEPFTIENKQMTPSLKVRRHVLREVYGERIDALYKG